MSSLHILFFCWLENYLDFVQGQLGKLIRENMSDKGKIFIGGGVSEKYSGTTVTGFEAWP